MPPVKVGPMTLMSVLVPLIVLEWSIRMPYPVALMTPESMICPVIVLLLMTAMPVGSPGETVPVLLRAPVNDVLLMMMQAVAPELV
jgi:hypothetical protein